MKQFKVAYHYEERGFAIVVAKTEKEAENIVHKELEESGVDRLDNTNILYREYGASDAKEVDHESE